MWDWHWLLAQTSGPNHPYRVKILAPKPEWDSVLWLVTHADLHRTAKVQAFLQFVTERFGKGQPE